MPPNLEEQRPKKKFWTPEEDALLTELVQEAYKDYPMYGKWLFIADQIKGRTRFQCRARWEQVLHPDRKKGPWSKEEDAMLMKLVQEFKNGYRKDSSRWTQHIDTPHLQGGRSDDDNQCWDRCGNHVQPDMKKGLWSTEENAMLIKFVQEDIHNNKNQETFKWANIATHMGGRSGAQCKRRWEDKLRPDLKRGRWSKEEDATIVRLQRNMGNKWAQIATHVPGRTLIGVRHRFNWIMKKQNDSNADVFRQTDSVSSKGGGDSDMMLVKTKAADMAPPPTRITPQVPRTTKHNMKTTILKRHPQNIKAENPTPKTFVGCSKPVVKLPGKKNSTHSSTQSSETKALIQRICKSINNMREE